VTLDGAPHRVLYRHLSARYVDLSTPLVRAFLDPVRHGMWNRVDGWLETKGLFAELSLQAAGARFLAQDEREAVADLVPWTRLLDDIPDFALGDGDRFVLKKSHDYGGKSVVIGREVGPAAFSQALARAGRRARQLGGAGAGGCAGHRALPLRQTGPAASRSTSTSAPTRRSFGVPDGGSVCRAAPGRVVNIVGAAAWRRCSPDEVLASLVADGSGPAP
jgi:hypothetical protein